MRAHIAKCETRYTLAPKARARKIAALGENLEKVAKNSFNKQRSHERVLLRAPPGTMRNETCLSAEGASVNTCGIFVKIHGKLLRIASKQVFKNTLHQMQKDFSNYDPPLL